VTPASSRRVKSTSPEHSHCRSRPAASRAALAGPAGRARCGSADRTARPAANPAVDPGAEHEHDVGMHGSIRHPRAAGPSAPRRRSRRNQRLHQLPQLVTDNRPTEIASPRWSRTIIEIPSTKDRHATTYKTLNYCRPSRAKTRLSPMQRATYIPSKLTPGSTELAWLFHTATEWGVGMNAVLNSNDVLGRQSLAYSDRPRRLHGAALVPIFCRLPWAANARSSGSPVSSWPDCHPRSQSRDRLDHGDPSMLELVHSASAPDPAAMAVTRRAALLRHVSD
jgi:hypothetical protein